MPITHAEAVQLIAAAHRRASEIGIRVTVAVVDEGGLLQALGRMDGAPPLSAQIAEAKCVGAALWQRDGSALAEVLRDRPAFFSVVSSMARIPMVGGLGSLLLKSGDAVLGAVGVSGGRPEQDVECAEAGIAAIGERS